MKIIFKINLEQKFRNDKIQRESQDISLKYEFTAY